MLGLRFCARAFSSCSERGHSSSWCAGLSLSRPLLLWSTGSRRAGSVVVARGPSCSAAYGILPDQGTNPRPLHWQADSQPLRHQGSPYLSFKYISSSIELSNLNRCPSKCFLGNLHILSDSPIAQTIVLHSSFPTSYEQDSGNPLVPTTVPGTRWKVQQMHPLLPSLPPSAWSTSTWIHIGILISGPFYPVQTHCLLFWGGFWPSYHTVRNLKPEVQRRPKKDLVRWNKSKWLGICYFLLARKAVIASKLGWPFGNRALE